ncbi:NAD(P)/FAD-dependent oxidoreductase, partial [Mycobacterium tuberculosis]|nr:NAD(P)/FAD-dependent oxidoreductase [Mycobacterium tuberculosis]
MTMTVDRPQLTADDIATGWLNDFASTLGSRDIEAAMGLFAATSFWRDLVSFSWNLTTTETHDGIRDLLQ